MAARLRTDPAFDLRYRFDDPSDPTELTGYVPDPENAATQWLTVDRETARSLDRVR